MAITLKKAAPMKSVVVMKKKPVSLLPAKKTYSLPTKPIEPVHDLGAYSWLIYGQKKIGKSTLASLFPGALFFMFEPGAKALRVYRVDCGTWEDALGNLKLLEEQKKAGKLAFETIILDTGFELYQKAFAYGCAELNIEYPREDNFGKDWTFIKNEVRKFHSRIFDLGLGVVVLCHETTKEQQTYTGNKYDQVVPLLPKPCDEYYRAVVDNVCWYHYRGKDRFLQIRGTDHAMAGIALQADEFFKTPAGEQIYAIPIPSDPKKGLTAIEQAFENKQRQTFKEETEKMSEESVKHSIHEKLRKAQKKGRQ